MNYRSALIPKTQRDLAGFLSVAMMHVPTRSEFERIDFDGFFYTIELGIENLRFRFGKNKTDQLLEMARQARAHYERGGRHTSGTPANPEVRLGGQLMEDTKMVVLDRRPWAYPKELYRWAINPSHPDLSEKDLSEQRSDTTDF